MHPPRARPSQQAQATRTVARERIVEMSSAVHHRFFRWYPSQRNAQLQPGAGRPAAISRARRGARPRAHSSLVTGLRCATPRR
ncbi:hypothetical protein XH94_15695 [Bradyrhizobium zhanjiangense]|uniref:Uncharacterized protein n=1 Tax=Bradyrhizobium zhanjiangense TaxID=1325107 RepID=A0A4Q0SNX6_9BRAD|nr:hypothetical protein XH94_15695 [Bradyrhizobium zhanjiangense]